MQKKEDKMYVDIVNDKMVYSIWGLQKDIKPQTFRLFTNYP